MTFYKTEEKGPQLCLLNKPFYPSLEELRQSGHEQIKQKFRQNFNIITTESGQLSICVFT